MIGTIDELEPKVFVKDEKTKTTSQVWLNPNFYSFRDTDAQEKIQQLREDLNYLTDNDESGIDSIAELVQETTDIKNNLGTVTHVHHSSDGTTAGPKETFTPSANGVNFQCTSAKTSNVTQHAEPLPIASTTQAGIVTASFMKGIEDNEEVVSSALVDLDSRILALVARVEALEGNQP